MQRHNIPGFVYPGKLEESEVSAAVRRLVLNDERFQDQREKYWLGCSPGFGI